jgi:hypothetical protein
VDLVSGSGAYSVTSVNESWVYYSEYTGPANQGLASIAGIGTASANVVDTLTAQADDFDQLEQHLTDSFNGAGQGGNADASSV